MTAAVHETREGAIVTLTISDPGKLNAMSQGLSGCAHGEFRAPERQRGSSGGHPDGRRRQFFSRRGFTWLERD
jgi:hypothetical protein